VVSASGTQISFVGGSFQGVSGIGATHSTVYSSAPTSWSDAVTTTKNNSIVVSAAQLCYATALATSTGTQQAETGFYAGSGNTVTTPQVLVTTIAPTSGTVVTSAGTSTAQYYGTQLSVELLGVTPHSNSSPIITIAGQVWDSTGPSSIADIWTIQDVIANATDGASTLTIAHTGSTGLAAVSLPALILTASSTPTSAHTPGTAGQFAWDTTNLYFCSVSGPGGGATQWNKLVLVPII